MAKSRRVFSVLVVAAALTVHVSAGRANSYATISAAAEQEPLRPASGAAADEQACGSQPDEICSLPGLTGNPHVRMRSGYITVSEVSDRQLWYLLADREPGAAERGSAEPEGAAPVLLWLTGGPGCSSLDAWIYEHGPFRFSYADEHREGGHGGQRPRDVVLSPNPNSWTKLATVIYVDSPAGAGMSYSGRPDVDYHTNDEYTIADLVTFLQGLTKRYPELATAPFYIAGESYGGVFVPLLARELLRVNRRRRDAKQEPLVNLQGYAVGNPVTDDSIDGNAQMFFAADMGYMDPPTWRHARDACGDMFWNATPGTECWDAQGVVKDDLWDLNWYDVLEPCSRDTYGQAGSAGSSGSGLPSGGSGARRQARSTAGGNAGADSLDRRFYWPFTVRMGPQAKEQQEPAAKLEAGRRGGRRLWGPWLRHTAPCMDRRISLDWLNRDEVRSALHAAPVSRLEWQPCSDVLYYRLDTADLVALHEELVRQGLRALVYSGDHDMVVPHTGTRAWLYDKARLGRPAGPLRAWTMDGQIAGFTARFRAGSGLTFATVKGAGHMVPQSRPREALHLLGAFLNDQEL